MWRHVKFHTRVKPHRHISNSRPLFTDIAKNTPICIVGAGPAGYYTADFLLQSNRNVRVDIFEKSPTPFGLVRSGVAPDHPEVKAVEKRFSDISEDKRVRFFGNVEVGGDLLKVEELSKYYPIIVFAIGASENKKLNLKGEDLIGVHSARDFVGWYNCVGNFDFNLDGDCAVIIGNGNVAIDIARILLKSPEQLKSTDINDETLEALKKSNIKNVHLVGRRGPVQAAYTTKELREISKLDNVRIALADETLILTDSCKEELKNRVTKRKFQLLEEILRDQAFTIYGSPKSLFLHFLKSPISFSGSNNHVESVDFILNNQTGPAGAQRAIPTDKKESIPAQIVFSSIGYRSVPIPGLPFDHKQGIIPNQHGKIRTQDEDVGAYTGLYVSGWVKGGPSGTIGTTLNDAEDTAHTILKDWETGNITINDNYGDVKDLLESKNVPVIGWNHWKTIDKMEVENGKKDGKPRKKFINMEEIALKVRKNENVK